MFDRGMFILKIWNENNAYPDLYLFTQSFYSKYSSLFRQHQNMIDHWAKSHDKAIKHQQEIITHTINKTNMNSFLRRRFSKILVTVFATVLTFMHAGAQSVGDYFCVSSGNWDDVSIWLRYNGTGWVVPAAPPTYTDGEIHIDTAFTVSVNTNKIFDQLYVGSTASLFVKWRFVCCHNGPGSTLPSMEVSAGIPQQP